jgi:hypothetical protein
MATFEFITDDQFRASLESDYKELDLCLRAGAWKAACVLAGSIIEAVLADYLLARRYQKKDPLKMELADMITACQQEGILTDKTVGLTNAIRLYRNLIHPGRAVRLGEVANENAARVAQPLVEIVIEEVACHKEKTYGPTAEQIVSKVERDPSAISVVRHLLRSAKPVEIERLLVDVAPRRYLELLGGGALATEAPLPSLEECFRSAVGVASNDSNVKMAQQYVTILREGDESRVSAYQTAFFRGQDLRFLSAEDQSLVKEHLLTQLRRTLPDERFLRTLQGIGGFLTPAEVPSFVGGILKTTLTWDTAIRDSGRLSHAGLLRLEQEYRSMTAEAKEEMLGSLNIWITESEGQPNPPLAETQLMDRLKTMKAALDKQTHS